MARRIDVREQIARPAKQVGGTLLVAEHLAEPRTLLDDERRESSRAALLEQELGPRERRLDLAASVGAVVRPLLQLLLWISRAAPAAVAAP